MIEGLKKSGFSYAGSEWHRLVFVISLSVRMLKVAANSCKGNVKGHVNLQILSLHDHRAEHLLNS